MRAYEILGVDWQEWYVKVAPKEEVKAMMDRATELQKVSNYTTSREMRHCGQIPSLVYYAIEKIEPGFWREEDNGKKFIEMYPLFRTVKTLRTVAR